MTVLVFLLVVGKIVVVIQLPAYSVISIMFWSQ